MKGKEFGGNNRMTPGLIMRNNPVPKYSTPSGNRLEEIGVYEMYPGNAVKLVVW